MSAKAGPFVALSLLVACSTAPVQKAGGPKGDEPWPPADAALGISDPVFASMMSEHWAWSLEESPLWATELGIHQLDDRIDDRSQTGFERKRDGMRSFLSRARDISARNLSSSDRTTLELLIEQLESEIESEVCLFEEWTISPLGNPVTQWNFLPELHRVDRLEQGQNLLERYRRIARSIEHEVDNLRRGSAKGLFANAESTRRVIAMLKTQLAQPYTEWPLLAPARKSHDQWPSSDLSELRSELEEEVQKKIQPALVAYLSLLEKEILPFARSEEKSGLFALPIGPECYRARIKHFTTLHLDAAEVHQIGLDEITRINQEMRGLGQKLFDTQDLPQILKKLRSDPELYFENEAAVEGKARSALAKAKVGLPGWFGIQPKADCVVTRIPDYEAPYSTIAYYRAPIPDGSKPGEYFVNVHLPKTRPIYEAEVLAFHESIPGHHLQIAIAQERSNLPAFRKHLSMTSYVEGWALYTERVADQMGLYTGDLDRMGMLSYDAWRASRLVVDTGIHALGWSRERAVSYLLEHTALAENNVRNEVDRYIVWPGQALAYKLGQLELLRLRTQAQVELGERYSHAAFHDVVLEGGAVSLPVLRKQVEAWLKAKKDEPG